VRREANEATPGAKTAGATRKDRIPSYPSHNLIPMVVLRPDPWDPGYGAGAEAPHDDAAKVLVDPAVETSDWSRPLEPPPCPPEAMTFVDGVMRIDLRVLAHDRGRSTWGLLGSFGAAGVRCDGAASFVGMDDSVGRALILGGRVNSAPLEVTAGACQLVYEARSIALDDNQSLRIALQRLMIEAEQRMAARLARDGLVVADGPLRLNSGGDLPIVGVVKRMVTAYLRDEHAALLTRLEPGQRTPIFAIGNNVIDRLAWYQRLLPANGLWHELAGLVRCEVRLEHGVARARPIADRLARTLVRFAGRPGIDPRAPQNLIPVGALEARLRHLLGHPTVVRRALQRKLAEAA
jgi:hypothetical protein